MSATLGGLIKDYRLQKNISQLEISFALGWTESSRLSRIEQGVTEKPKRDIVDKIIQAMRLTEEEKNQLLFTGGYLPTDEEIELFRKKIGPRMEEWPYPASAMDFSWRVVYDNQILYSMFNVSKKQADAIRRDKPHILELVFDPRFILNHPKNESEKKKRHEFLIRMLSHFQHAQKTRTREKWYQNLIKRMMNNELFKQLWSESQNYVSVTYDVANYSPKFGIPSKEGQILNLYMFIVPVLKDSRFTIEFHTPADKETFEYFKKIK